MAKHNNDQSSLFAGQSAAKAQGPLECLGMTFPNDEERRKYFLCVLREKLKDPEFRKIEGFPIGSDEDILALSDPPYYTACPNPFIPDFIKHYGKPYDSSKPYNREPFAADVSEGKYDPFYKVHSYPTKVPFRAILRFILHYTVPDDVVFDGFSGTGMTAIASMLSSFPDPDTKLLIEKEMNAKWGKRLIISNDLSPAAYHIAKGYTTRVDPARFLKVAMAAVDDVEDDLAPLYCHNGERFNYAVWSDVLACPNCQQEFDYWTGAVNYTPEAHLGSVSETLKCPACSSTFRSGEIGNRAWTTFTDSVTFEPIRQAKQVPILLNYSDSRGRHERFANTDDIAHINNIQSQPIPFPVPVVPLPKGFNTEQPRQSHGIQYCHQFFTNRNLWAFSSLVKKAEDLPAEMRTTYLFALTASLNRITRLVRYMPQHKERNVGPLSGTLYIPPLSGELNVINVFRTKLNKVVAGLKLLPSSHPIFSVQSSSDLRQIPQDCIDYIFIDPPFGGNIMYSELASILESWIGVMTNNTSEAIVNEIQGKGFQQYRSMMTRSFGQFYRILKPGRWMTVEFHNSKNAIWNAIQESIQESGFIVADVRVFDKKKGTIKQMSTASAVKQDLIISAYKPNSGLEGRFNLEAGTEEGVWDFVRTHFNQLPVFVSNDAQAEVIAERQNYLLFDRMVAFHVQRGVTVPISASEFYAGLNQRFSERDDMYFLPEQVAEYDKKRMTVQKVLQLQLFVIDESSAIQWLKQQLTKKPQTFQELHSQFLKEIGGWQKHEKPLELSELLKDTFLCYDSKGDAPSQIHSYLSTNFKELRNLPKDAPELRAKGKDRWYVPDPNKAGDLEKLRERSLLKEFEEYRTSSQKRLKVFRIEAVRAGFKKAWQDKSESGYRTIIEVAKKIPENVLQEDPKLLMWYDQALTRIGDVG